MIPQDRGNVFRVRDGWIGWLIGPTSSDPQPAVKQQPKARRIPAPGDATPSWQQSFLRACKKGSVPSETAGPSRTLRPVKPESAREVRLASAKRNLSVSVPR